jgi:hypothetical protein
MKKTSKLDFVVGGTGFSSDGSPLPSDTDYDIGDTDQYMAD